MIVGAGGHAREVLDVVEAINAVAPRFSFLGFAARDASDADAFVRRGLEILGDESVLVEFGAAPSTASGADASVAFTVAIGDPATRSSVAASVPAGLALVTLVHPAAAVDATADLGAGSMVPAGAVVSAQARLGRQVHLNVNAVVGERSVLGDFATLSPGSIVGRDVTLGDRVLIGAGAVIADGVVVGDEAVVGAGAVVEADVSAGATMKGRPAR